MVHNKHKYTYCMVQSTQHYQELFRNVRSVMKQSFFKHAMTFLKNWHSLAQTSIPEWPIPLYIHKKGHGPIFSEKTGRKPLPAKAGNENVAHQLHKLIDWTLKSSAQNQLLNWHQPLSTAFNLIESVSNLWSFFELQKLFFYKIFWVRDCCWNITCCNYFLPFLQISLDKTYS